MYKPKNGKISNHTNTGTMMPILMTINSFPHLIPVMVVTLQDLWQQGNV